MSKAWKETTIGQCLEASFSGEWGAEPKPANALVFRATDIDDEGRIIGSGAERRLPIGKLTAKRLQDGDILLEGSGGGPDKPVGRVAYFESATCQGSAVCSNFFKTLRPNRSEVDPRFLLHKLAWFYKQPTLLTFQQQTTGIINLKFEEYLSAPIEIPKTVDEQQKLAQVLDTLDTAIHETDAIIAKLKAVKQGLLHDLLTRGIDANGELRPPQAEAPHLYKESLLGWIPKEWVCKPFGELCESSAFGPRFPSDAYDENGPLATLRTTDMDDEGNISLSTMPRAAIKPSVFVDHLLRPGDIVISRSGTCGVTGVFTCHDIPVVPGAFLIRFRLRDLRLNRFYRRYFNSSLGRPYLERLAVGGVQKNIKGSDVLCLQVPSLEPTEAVAIGDRIESVEHDIESNQQLLRKLKLQKAGLMDDLLTGRVRVTPLLETAAP